MKTIKNILILLSLTIAATSCTNAPNFDNYIYPPADDKSALTTLIDECFEQWSQAKVGTAQGEYLDFVKDNFDDAINEAKRILTNDKATQEMVGVAVKKLKNSQEIFLSSVNTGPVDDNDKYLSLHLRFTGNMVDSSPLGHYIQAMSGNSLCGNGPRPSLVTDRFGVENQAARFDKGGYLSIPFVDGLSESLNPETMSFMCWIKQSNPPADVQQWIFCLNTWNIFFLVMPPNSGEIQFGGQTTRGWLTYSDYPSGVEASSSEWSHIAVTYSTEGLCFYKNGELISRYAGMGPLVYNDAKTPFLIGVMSPQSNLFYGGDLDEIRLYNKALTEKEVAAIFAIEKMESMVTDKTGLEVKITEATTLKNSTVTGYAIGEYLPKVVDAFGVSISSAKEVYDNQAATQNQVNKAITTLSAAVENFEDAANKVNYDPNLMLSLTFDETLSDESHMAHKVGAFTGLNDLPPYPAIDRYGRYDGACHFDKGSYLAIPYDISINGAQITYMFWVKAASPTNIGAPYIMNIGGANGFYLGLNGDDKFVYGGKGTGSSANITEQLTNVTATGVWKHIAITYKQAADNPVRIYENGTLVGGASGGSARGELARVTDSSPFVIGVKGASDHTASYFRGDLDEIRVYQTALSDAQIQAVYNAQKP